MSGETTSAWCPRCGGNGELDVNPSRTNDPACAITVVCPECRGTGRVEYVVVGEVRS